MRDTMLPKSTQRLRCTPWLARPGTLTPMIGSVSEDQGDTQQAWLPAQQTVRYSVRRSPWHHYL